MAGNINAVVDFRRGKGVQMQPNRLWRLLMYFFKIFSSAYAFMGVGVGVGVGVATQKFLDMLRAPVVEPPFLNF